MYVSMDGIRRNLAEAVIELKDAVRGFNTSNLYHSDLMEYKQIRKELNNVICTTNLLCSIYDDNYDGDLNEIKILIEQIEESEE